jgi:hypothetical protein
VVLTTCSVAHPPSPSPFKLTMNWEAGDEPSFRFGFQLGDADNDATAAAAPTVPELAGEELTQGEVDQALDAAADVRAHLPTEPTHPTMSKRPDAPGVHLQGSCEAVRICPDLSMLKVLNPVGCTRSVLSPLCVI